MIYTRAMSQLFEEKDVGPTKEKVKKTNVGKQNR